MLTNSKLALATTTESDVLSGKTFYAGSKTLRTGNIVSKAAESKTITPSSSSQSYTFATSGKYCTGNMSVTVNGIALSAQLTYVGSFNANGNAGGTGCRTPEGGVESNMYSYENTWVKFTTQVNQSRVTVTTKLSGNYMIVGRNWGPKWWYGVSAGTVLVSELYDGYNVNYKGAGRYNWEIFYYA